MWGNSSLYNRDDQIFHIWSEQTNTKQRIWKTVVAIKSKSFLWSCEQCKVYCSNNLNCSKNLICRKIWYRWWNSFQIFDLILRNFISFFWDFNRGSNRKGHLQNLYWNLRKKWWNDESARPSALLKLESTTDIFIDQVHKFQNSDFKEYPWKAVNCFTKKHVF